jgi:hypothetical protein
MKFFVICFGMLAWFGTKAQIPEAIYSPKIKTAQLFAYGNQGGFPVLRLNSSDQLELHFDDLYAGVKNYSYTFQLCNADWTPAMLNSMDYIRGFSQTRISNYRVSSIAYTRYTHYQAIVPDRNCVPTRSGNYILKVFADGDTSKLLFTKRMLVLDEKAAITAQIQQPYNGLLFRTHQKIQFRVALSEQFNVPNPIQQINVAILQNDQWATAATKLRPSFFSRNTLDYNTENDAVFPGGKEWRWVDLRSFRFQSQRVANVVYNNKSTEIFIRPDVSRAGQQFNLYQDANGKYGISVTENINPLWQSDYANVHFSYVPPGNSPYPDKDVYIFGQLTNYELNDSTKMVYNAEKGVYETTLFLKQGYYDYMYLTKDRNNRNQTPSFDATEGNLWETENNYLILVYYRALGGRVDELVGLARVNSLRDRRGL